MEQDTYHYHVIRRAIEAIDAADVPLSLDALAEDMGMSTAHFQPCWPTILPRLKLPIPSACQGPAAFMICSSNGRPCRQGILPWAVPV